MKKIGIRDIACTALLLFPLTGWTAEGGDHFSLQKTSKPDYLESRTASPFQLPSLEPQVELVASSDNSKKFKLERVEFHGNQMFSNRELETVASPYLGQRVNDVEIEHLRQQLTRFYIDRGYVTSGVLLGQSKGEGVISFEVVEGHLSSLHLRGMGRLNDNYIARKLVRSTDEPLNINTLRERYQLLLSDPLIESMNARLLPGTNQGEAILDVDVVQARPYQLTASLDNYRPPSIGSESFNLSGTMRNLSGRGDWLEATLQNPLQSSGFRASLSWYMPLGYCGTQFSIALDHGRSSVVEEPAQALNIQSTLDSRDIGLSQALLETLKHKLTLGLNRINRENRTTLQGSPFSFIPGEPEGVSSESLWRFWQEYSFRSETEVLALRSSFTTGSNNIQDATGMPVSYRPIQRQYSLWLGQAQYAHQLMGNGSQLVFRETVQLTSDHLLPLDGMSIGGVNSVRGYRENQLVRDNGEFFNIEFEYPLLRNSSQGVNLTLIPFYDIGRGWNNNDYSNTISSLGVAGKVQWQHFKLDMALAHRLVFPDSLSGSTLQDKGIHFQLSYTID